MRAAQQRAQDCQHSHGRLPATLLLPIFFFAWLLDNIGPSPFFSKLTIPIPMTQMPCMACVHACSTWGECGSVVFNTVVVEKRDLRDFCKCPNFMARAAPPTSWRKEEDDDEQRCAAGQSFGRSGSSKHRCKDDKDD